MQTTNCIEVYSPNDVLLFKVLLVEKKQNSKNNGNGSNGSREITKKKTSKEDFITEPQSRLLFRLMAQNGKVGDEALEELKEIFQVGSLKEVKKNEASKMIEELLQNQNGG